MIKGIRYEGLKLFYETGKAAGIQPAHARRLGLQLAALDSSRTIEDMDIPGFRVHALKGDRKGQFSIRVNDQFRICFVWTEAGPAEVEIVDYH